MLPTKKSGLLGATDPPSYFHAKIIDGPAVVCLPCKLIATFEDTVTLFFNSLMKKKLMSCDRIHPFWDVYKEDSLN